MIVRATASLNVSIDPKEVIKSLLEQELGNGIIGEEAFNEGDRNNLFFIERYESHGPHQLPIKEYIPEERYNYIVHLVCVLDYLKTT